VDLLYSTAWLDLGDQPIVVNVPEMGRRYYVMQLVDAWTNVFADLGARMRGGEPNEFAITGPEWNGVLPPTLPELKAPTGLVRIIIRIQTDGRSDYAEVHGIQDKCLLTPLSEWGIAYQPPGPRHGDLDEVNRAHPLEQLATMDASTFFRCHGWEFTPRQIGRYGTDYLLRAATAMTNLGANLREDAIDARAASDREGRPLDGHCKYSLTLSKNAMPPARAFWSITMYDVQQGLVANAIGRYATGDRDRLTTDADGGLTLHIQHESPGTLRQANWLPAPLDTFNLILRLYWPSEQVLGGRWRPPAIHRLD
jgi:hypothetical protein